MTTPSADGAFWPPLGGIFDLTLHFEETIFNLIPSSIVVASAPIIITQLLRSPICVRNSTLLWAKLAVVAALVGVEIDKLVFWATSPKFHTETTMPAASIDLVAAMAIGIIIYTEHRYAIRGLAFVAVYLLIATLFDIMKCRSFFQRPGLSTLGALAASSGALRVALLGLQEVPKTRLFLDTNSRQHLGGELTSGYWSRSLFLYLNPMFMTGFRTVLGLQDLQTLGPEYASKILYPQLQQYWKKAKEASGSGLFLTCFQAWKGLFLAILIPRLCHSGFCFAQPFLLYRIITLIGQEESKSTTYERVSLLLATILTFVGKTLAQTATSHMKNGLVTRIRGALISTLVDKSLNLPQHEANKSAALTLMSADLDGIASGIPQLHELIVTIFETGLGVYLLSRFVGYSCFVVFVPLVASTVVTYFTGKWMASSIKVWNESIQSRVAKTSKIVSQLTALKSFGLAETIELYLHKLREMEMTASKKYRNVQAVANIPILCADLITPVVVIAAALFWGSFDGRLSALNVFPSLTIIIVVKSPLMSVLNAYPTLTIMFGCFRRFQDFLLLEERQDPRTVMGDAVAQRTVGESNTANRATVVQFEGAKIAPMGTGIPILQDINFTITSGSITGVVGPNGSGKSLLLQSMLILWLRNTSIKLNVIGPRPYDEIVFNKVIRCCLLEEDIRQLPGGEDYVVGTGGARLSGGQRQRVTLARTLYARMSFVLLDNVFSSLDHKTALSILFRLCGQDGFFRELGTTVVLTSYLPELFDVVDQLLALDGNGSVTVDLNFKKSTSRSKYLQILNPQKVLRSEEEEEKEQAMIRRSQDQQRPAVAESEEPKATAIGGSRNLALYRLFFDPIGFSRTVLWCIAMFVVSAGEVAPEVYMRIWIDLHPGDSSYFAGYTSIAAATCLLFALVYASLGNHLTPRAALGLHQQLASTLVRSTVAFLGATDKGVLVNKFSQDMTLIVRNLPISFMRTIYIFWTSLIQTGIVGSGSSYMGAAIPLIIVVVFSVQHFYLRTSRQMRALDLETKSPLYTHFEETAAGLVYIRGFGWQAENLRHGMELLDDSQKPFYYMFCIHQWLELVLGLLIALLASILVALALFLNKSTSETAIGLAFFNLILFGNTLEMLIIAYTALETSVGALTRLQEFLEKTPQEPAHTTVDVPKNWPSRGNVELRNVYAQYSDDSGRSPVLRNISLTVAAGQKVGLIGRTGSGKSSFFLTLLGFLPYKGVLKIDGIDISSIPPNTLRSRIVTISQDQIKLDANVRVNLLPFSLNTKAEMDEKRDTALRELLIRLGIWSRLSSIGGLDAMLDDAGYSHGEMQLFCIARGILRYQDTGSKVVLIDEATSSVELDREKSTQKIMEECFPGCTILVIGHRRSTIRGVDLIVELSNGEVVQSHSSGPASVEGGISPA